MPLLDHAEDHAARILRPNFLSDRNDRVFSRHSSARFLPEEVFMRIVVTGAAEMSMTIRGNARVFA